MRTSLSMAPHTEAPESTGEGRFDSAASTSAAAAASASRAPVQHVQLSACSSTNVVPPLKVVCCTLHSLALCKNRPPSPCVRGGTARNAKPITNPAAWTKLEQACTAEKTKTEGAGQGLACAALHTAGHALKPY